MDKRIFILGAVAGSMASYVIAAYTLFNIVVSKYKPDAGMWCWSEYKSIATIELALLIISLLFFLAILYWLIRGRIYMK